MFSEELVEWGDHGGLHEVAAKKHLVDLVLREGIDFDVFVGIKMLGVRALHSYGEVAVGEVVHRAGVA